MNEQNDSPFSNPKFLTSIIVVFVFLWGWQYFITKKYPQATTTNIISTSNSSNTNSNTIESTAKVENTNVIKDASIQEVNGTQNTNQYTEKTFSYEDDKVKWSLSSSGMGLNFFELKNYTDRLKKPIQYQFQDKLFSNTINDKVINYDVTQVSPTEFVGKAQINDSLIERKITYNKEKGFFESSIKFDKSIPQISFSMIEKKHVIHNSSFLMPSFEKQDFLYKELDKIQTEQISAIKEGTEFSKSVSQLSLASINSQYFTESFLDKSEIVPNGTMKVVDSNVSFKINYELQNSQIKELKQLYYLGPKSNEHLSAIDPILPEVMDYGMFGFISKPLLLLMRFLHQIFGNWGLAIIALTLVVRLIMLPFNILSFKSSRAMQKIQPQLQAIREKYKGDPLSTNRETMALMKEQKANPLSGCLPMLIQIPIFFALWKTIGSSIEIYQQPFFGWITDLSSHDSFFVLPILMGITMFFQQKLTPSTMDPAQQKILNFMPIIFSVFMLSLPSGLTLYNFISSLFGVIQQYFLLKEPSPVVSKKVSKK